MSFARGAIAILGVAVMLVVVLVIAGTVPKMFNSWLFGSGKDMMETDVLAKQANDNLPLVSAEDFRMEFERHVFDPCLKIAVEEHIDASLLETHGIDEFTASAKAASTQWIAELAASWWPYVQQQEWVFRANLYAIYREVCVLDFRRHWQEDVAAE